MSKSIKLTKDPIWTLLRKVTIPASVGSLFQTFYNLVDTWFAGRISAEAIGAIAKSFPIYFTIIAVGHQEGGWICRGRRRWPNGVSYEPGWGGSEGFGVIPQSLWDSAGSALI